MQLNVKCKCKIYAIELSLNVLQFDFTVNYACLQRIVLCIVA